jgi:hypothetical protein
VEFPDKSGVPKHPQMGPAQPREKKEPVVAGATKVKRPITRRFFNFLQAESPKAAAARIGQEVLIPQMKMGLEAACIAFVRNMFWGNNANRPMSNMVQKATLLGAVQNNPYPYSQISSGVMQQPNGMSPQQRSTGNYEDLVYPSVQSAQKVLAMMLDYLQHYPVVAVGDLYEWSDIITSPSDNSFGWSSLDGARIVPGQGGFVLELPSPSLI